jgi:hypothetical protein
MANTYKNAAVVMTSTGATDLYSCPANTRAIVQSVNVANIDGSDRYVTVTWFDSSTAQNYTLLYNGLIPAGTALNALDVPLVLEPGDIVRVQASAANTLHATASILQSDPTSAIVDQSVTTAKLADLSVTSAKMATGVSPTIICTSTTRPASPFEGQAIYETDTDQNLVYTGSAWYPPWNLPWGILGSPASRTSSLSVPLNQSTALVDMTDMTRTVTLVFGRRYRASLYASQVNGTSGERGRFSIFQATQSIQNTYFNLVPNGATLNMFATFTGSGVTTIKAQMARDVGSFTMSIYADGISPMLFAVEDIGPA